MWNSRTAFYTSYMMWMFVLFLLLLTGSLGELKSPEKKNEVTSERVLIRSKRRWALSAFKIKEESPGPFPDRLELHNDKHLSELHRFRIKGQGVTTNPLGLFTINDTTGIIYVHKPIDRESYPILKVQFDVLDQSNELLDETLYFDVIIEDINDNYPLFEPEVLIVQVPENTKEGVLPLSLKAADKDEEDNDNSRISMRILSQVPASPNIALQSGTSMTNSMFAKLSLTGCFDYDKVKNYTIIVEARDHGEPSLSSTATINISITDSNTHAPVFSDTKFNAQVMEMESNKEILRIPVKDLDAPNTPGSRAVFTILKGNEDGNYKIETDPVTNEGVLTVIKGKDYERTTLTELEIGVENEEPLFLCVNGKPVTPVPKALKKDNTVKVAIKVIDVNDPPEFRNKIQKVFKVEEEEPGDVLYTPTVTDEDSDPTKVRYELLEDPAKWMSIDPKTGTVTLEKKMDRESPHVHNSTYTVLIHAIDDGEPPATGTGTLLVHLGDKNDNKPYLASNTVVMCGNKADRVKISAEDADVFPYSGPFTFTLDTDDPELKSLWKLERNIMAETSLIRQEILQYRNYTVPLKIADQQGAEAQDVLHVILCDCGKGDVCLSPEPLYTSLNGAAIGIILGALLMMAVLLCFIFVCKCQEKILMSCDIPEGNQTLMKYNEERLGSLCRIDELVNWYSYPEKAEQTELRHSKAQPQEISTNQFHNLNTGSFQVSNGFRSTINSRHTFRKSSSRTGKTQKRTYSTTSNGSTGFNFEGVISRILHSISVTQDDIPEYQPRDYSSEGPMNSTMSLDKLSICSTENNLALLQNLGPKFNALDEICQQATDKNVKL